MYTVSRLNFVVVYECARNFYGLRIGLVAVLIENHWPIRHPVIAHWTEYNGGVIAEYEQPTLGLDGVE